MSALRIIIWSIAGPILIWLALLTHVFYQFAFVDPLPVKVAGWPSGTDESVKNIIIQNRKYILQDFKDAISKGDNKKLKSFIDNRLTDDFIWEDPTMKLIGKDEFADMMGLSKYVSDVQFEVLGEKHSTHEMLLDWKLIIFMKNLPSYSLTLPMRTHFLLEPAENPGSGEKLFKIYEEWYGHEHMNESNTKPSVLGYVHQLLRRYSGQGFSWIMRKGIL